MLLFVCLPAEVQKNEVEPIFAALEMDRSKLTIGNELGSGQFGVVYKGFALGLDRDKEEPVAVKGLKSKS